MRLSERIKPISYLKANAARIFDDLRASGEPMIITQNGEAKAVIQDIKSYEEMEETLAFLKILALGERQIDEGKISPAKDVFNALRKRNREFE